MLKRYRQSVTQRKFAILFLFLLAYLVLYPYAANAGVPYLALRIFGAVVTLLGVYAVSFRRSFVLFALVLAVPAFVQRIVLPRGDAGALSVLSIVLSLVFDVFIVVVIFRRVFIKDEHPREAIFGALCVYLLIGFSFANVYGFVATVAPHAFYVDPAINPHGASDRFAFIYYSFATLTCVGPAGIAPASDPARSISIVESLLGVLYLAVLISRLVSAHRERSAES